MLAYNLSLLYNCSRLDVLLFVFYLSVSRQDGAKRKSSLEMRVFQTDKPYKAKLSHSLLTILSFGTYLLLDTKQTVVFGDTLRTR